MDRLGEIHQLIVPVAGYRVIVNLEVLVMTWIVFFMLIAFGFVAARRRNRLPGSAQVIGEIIA